MDEYHSIAKRLLFWFRLAVVAMLLNLGLNATSFSTESYGWVIDCFSYGFPIVLLLGMYLPLSRAVKYNDIELFELACERQAWFIQFTVLLSILVFVLYVITVLIESI